MNAWWTIPEARRSREHTHIIYVYHDQWTIKLLIRYDYEMMWNVKRLSRALGSYTPGRFTTRLLRQ